MEIICKLLSKKLQEKSFNELSFRNKESKDRWQDAMNDDIILIESLNYKDVNSEDIFEFDKLKDDNGDVIVATKDNASEAFCSMKIVGNELFD
jgi:predicted RNA-binding protein with PUA domain